MKIFQNLCFLGKDPQCEIKDDDRCLQSDSSWTNYKCDDLRRGTSGFEYCETYAKLTKRCCPYACEVKVPFTREVCSLVTSSGTCVYPNKAQCGKLKIKIFVMFFRNH